MKNSMIYKIKTGQDLFSRGSYGNESFNSYDDLYDEDYVTALECLEIYVENYSIALEEMEFSIGSEGWSSDSYFEYLEEANESWAGIKEFFSKYAGKISGAFKSLFKKAEKAKTDADQLRDKATQVHKELQELRRKAKDPNMSDAARKAAEKNVQIRQREWDQLNNSYKQMRQAEIQARKSLEAGLATEKKALHDVDKAASISAKQKAYNKSIEEKGEKTPFFKKTWDKIKEKVRNGKKLSDKEQSLYDKYKYNKG